MPYTFYITGSGAAWVTHSYQDTPGTGSWFSSSNPDLIASGSASGYFIGDRYKPLRLDMSVSGSHSAQGIWSGSYVPYTESGANSHGIPVGSASIFTASWAYSGSYGEYLTGSDGAAPTSWPSGATQTASYEMIVDDNSNFIIQETSSAHGVNDRVHYFVSSSGKIGIKTKTPTNDIDLKADTIKFRSDDGSKEMEFRDGKWRAQKYANRGQYDDVVQETSGSEIVLAYSPGTFDVPTTASAGDRLGTITWEDESIGRTLERIDATAMEIYGKVEAVASDATAIKGSMHFTIGSATAGEPLLERMIVHLGGVTITGSNTYLQVTGRSIWLGNTADADGDTYINFLTNTSGKRWVAGIDVSATAFVIDQTALNVPQATSDFSLAAGGALTLGGALSCTHINTGQGATEVYAMNQDVETGDSVTFDTVITTKMPGFTGSTITVDGGTF